MIDTRLNIAKIGIEAEVFKASPFGKYLLEQAEREIKEETAILIDLDPTNIKANTESRNRIHVARMFITWLEQAINSGHLAADLIRNEDGNDSPDY